MTPGTVSGGGVPRAYYNEVDPYAAQWIRNLIAAGLVMPGDVDERSIVDVRPADVAGYTRCHFFAGIAVWDYALGLAGWPADRPIWTGSCPCQPFSAAGRRAGFDDERHLWPVWFDLIRQCRPAIVFGEQVEAAVRLGWLDAVLADLEGEGYACGATVFGAHSVGAPHIRQRLWFVADAAGERRNRSELTGAAGTPPSGGAEASGRRPAGFREPAGCGAAIELGNTGQPRGRRNAGAVLGAQGEVAGERGRVGHQPDELVAPGTTGLVGIATGRRCERLGNQPAHRQPLQAGQVSGFWSDADWLLCRDGKARPVEPGTFPLAHGAAARVGRLRAYGNAINAEDAVAIIDAFLDAESSEPAFADPSVVTPPRNGGEAAGGLR